MAQSTSKYNPVTPGRRGMTAQDFGMLDGEKGNRKLTKGSQRSVGRNNQGRITTRHRSTGGVKRKYRTIDWKRNSAETAVVKGISYDPNRSARIAFIEYDNKEQVYILAEDTMKVGDKISFGKKLLEVGNTVALQEIPSGLLVYNIEIRPGEGGKLARAAGTYGIVQGLDKGNVQVKLSSGKVIWINGRCLATIGQASNSKHATINIGKAGRHRRMGRRPTVRGKAMHPNAHPHGGGEGGNSIGLRKGPKTKWGALAIGVKTRRRKIKLVKV